MWRQTRAEVNDGFPSLMHYYLIEKGGSTTGIKPSIILNLRGASDATALQDRKFIIGSIYLFSSHRDRHI